MYTTIYVRAGMGVAVSISSLLHAMDSRMVFDDANKQFERARYEDAISLYDKAVAVARTNRAQCLIARGLDHNNTNDWVEGWREFDQRLVVNEIDPLEKPWTEDFDPKDKVVLCKSEKGMGFGDVVTFAPRYLQVCKDLGAKKTILHLQGAHKFLKRVLSRCEGIDEIVCDGDEVPTFDRDIYMMSMMRYLSSKGLAPTTLDTIPYPKGYIEPDDEILTIWRDKLRSAHQHKWPYDVDIALCWRASKNPVAGGTRIIDRDIPLSLLTKELGSIDFVHLYSVQGPGHRPISREEFEQRQKEGTLGSFDEFDVVEDTSVIT